MIISSKEKYRFELQVWTKSDRWKSLYAVPKESASLEDYKQIGRSFREFFDYDSPFKNCTIPFDMGDGRNGRYFV